MNASESATVLRPICSRSRRLGAEFLLVLAVAGALVLFFSFFGPMFLVQSERRAYEADRRQLQEAVDAYRERESALDARPWPTLSGGIGIPREGSVPGYQCGSDSSEVCSWIDMDLLTAGRYLPSADVINSADSTRNVTATNAPSGSYGWYLDAQGTVRSTPAFSARVGYP